LNYEKCDRIKNKIEEVNENYEINSEEMQTGEELAKEEKKNGYSSKISNTIGLNISFCRSGIIRQNFQRNEKRNNRR